MDLVAPDPQRPRRTFRGDRLGHAEQRPTLLAAVEMPYVCADRRLSFYDRLQLEVIEVWGGFEVHARAWMVYDRST